MAGPKKRSKSERGFDSELVAEAVAKSILEGDIVGFRFIFSPLSPAREGSSEHYELDKYAYLLPDAEMKADPQFEKLLALVSSAEIRRGIELELTAERPARLPSELLLTLGDNAVRKGKYSSAAQTYELLRIRGKMQEAFYQQADEALDNDDFVRAAHGYIVATGLSFNYAAFPEPLPTVFDFQTRALMLHGEYPKTLEDSVGMQETDGLLRTAFIYLLLSAEVVPRLEARPQAARLAFLRELVLQHDPDWPAFTERFRHAIELTRDFGDRMVQAKTEGGLAKEIEEQLGADPNSIPAHLLGRTIESGEWWQYLKELAYKHPPAALFVSRQAVGESEILVPRCRPDSPVARAVGLFDGLTETAGSD